MLDEVVTAIATGAAGNVIAYMLNGRVDALVLGLPGCSGMGPSKNGPKFSACWRMTPPP